MKCAVEGCKRPPEGALKLNRLMSAPLCAGHLGAWKTSRHADFAKRPIERHYQNGTSDFVKQANVLRYAFDQWREIESRSLLTSEERAVLETLAP